jgi:adenosylmethionine-8-amino-7-oxononanoate aminotransferase
MEFIEKDLKYIWHPYTQMKDAEELPPILIERAEGIKLYGANGKVYYDTIASWWCNVHGHCHPRIKEAIKNQVDQLDHILFAGFTHKPAILLAEKLISIAPKGLSKVFFSDNGSTSVETALKLSFQYWHNIGRSEKRRFLSLEYGYHGDTLGAMAVSDLDPFNNCFEWLFSLHYKASAPYCYRCPARRTRQTCNIECIGFIEDIVKAHASEICGIILEPLVFGAGGMIVYPKEYLEKVAEIATRFDLHLILDEVATGFGRTGKMFATEYTHIQPSFLCVSKGITGGVLPLGATLTTEKIYSAFYDDYSKQKTFYHGHTYTANPISVAASLASLQVFEEEGTMERCARIIPIFHQKLERFRQLPIVGDVRYIGMIGGFELVKDKSTKEPFSVEERIGYKVYKEGLKRGLILRPLGNVIYLFLPLCIKEEEIKEILELTYSVLSTIVS